MKPIAHLASGVVLGSCAYLLTNDPLHFVGAGIGTFILDVDHTFDFIREFGFKDALKRLANSFRFKSRKNILKRMIFCFHSWELLLLLVIFSFLPDSNPYIISFAIGAAVHLFMDQIGNEVHPLTYFMAYRAWVGFKGEFLPNNPQRLLRNEEHPGT